MKNKLLIILLAMIAGAGTLFAESGTCGANGDNLTWDLTDGVLTISGTGDMKDWNGQSSVPWYSYRSSIKSVVIETGVTSIGKYAFYSYSDLTSVNISDGVTKIGGFAFNGCKGLTAITIPNSVTSIVGSAFGGCTGLTSVTIPNSVTSIGELAFANCTGLTSVVIGDGVTSIGKKAFYTCRSLTSVTIGNSVTSIGSEAFKSCSNLASINIPDAVTEIGESVFVYCSGLTSVTIGDGVTSIGNHAFSQCTGLTSIKIGNSVTSINTEAFYNCTSLLSVTLPNSVTSIGKNAFYACKSLTSINIPDGVTSIGASAFYGCSSLTSAIDIPNGVTSIESATFSGCSSLTSINIPNSVTKILGSAFYGCSSLTSINIPNSVKSIGGSAFKECSNLASINIPDAVTSIQGSIFDGCSSLESINIPDGVTSIGEFAFRGCSSLTSIDIPNSVTSIGGYAFDKCSKLTSITIPNSVTNFGGYVLRDCRALTAVTLPNSLINIPDYTFSGCAALTSINIPTNVTKIGTYAFQNCTSLTSATIPEGVTDIGTCAFKNCFKLTSVNIPDAVTSIKGSTFYGCSSLASIDIPDSVNSIGDWAFLGCSSLTSINIPDAVTSIQVSTFEDCSSLESISIPDGVTSIGKNAFSDCTGLTSITIPLNVTSIGVAAFSGCKGLESITCEATTPPECATLAFDGVDKNIVLFVPVQNIPDYMAANTWKQFTNIQPISDNSAITITLPTDVSDGYYENMTLELLNIDSQLVQNRPVLNKREFKFIGQIKGNEYQASLKNSYGQVMGQTDTVKLGNANLKLTFDKLLRAKDVSLKVTIPDKTDVTDKVSVLWADSAGKALGYVSQLKAVAEGAKLKCKVTLRDELARQYVAPDTMRLTVDGEAKNLLTLQLQPMQQLALHGLVKDQQTGEIISDATVALTQQLGGDYNQSVTAKTGDNGQYELQGTNMQGELSVTATGYLPKTMEFGAIASDGLLPDVELEQFNGVIVSAWLTYTEAAPEGTEGKVTEGYNGNGDVAYQVYNQTKGAAVENFIIKDNLLYFPSDVEIGDELRVTASSHNNIFSPVSATCEITTSGIGYVTLPLVQRGSLKAIASSTEGNSVMGVLYDADGRFARSNIYRTTGLSFANLASGDYSLISMTSNALLRRVLLMSTLDDMGLVEGTDYVKNAVHIEDGRIATVNVPNVPALDIEKLRFTDSETYFIADKNVINVGQYNIISSRVYFAEQYAGRIGNVEYVVDLPEEIDFVENSAILGSNVCNYRIEDGRYIFPVEKLEDNHLKFCILHKTRGDFRVSGSIRFKMDGVQMVQPIGTAWVKANGFTINEPFFIKSSVLYVSGVEPVAYSSKVEIYDYDKLIGTTYVRIDGTWSAIIQLPSNAVIGKHAIKARMIISKTNVKESELKYIVYNHSVKMADQVDMLVQKLNQVSYSPFSDRESFYIHIAPRYWHYPSPYSTEYNFFAYFDDTEMSEADNVKIAVLASDGTTRTMKAKYDDAKQCYYATTHYPTSYKLPISTYAYLEEEYSPLSEEELSALIEEKEKSLVKVTQAAVNAAKMKGETEVLPGDEETLNMKYTVPGKEPLALTMKEMDYDEASAYVLENGPLIYRGEAGNIVYTLVNGIDEMELIIIDMDEHLALRSVITYAEIDNLGAGSRRRQVGPKKISWKALFTGTANVGSDVLSLLGLQDYLKAPGQYDEMDSRRATFKAQTDRIIASIENLLAQTCCDGSPKYSPEQKSHYYDKLENLIDSREDLLSRMNDASDAFMDDLVRKSLWDIGTTVLGGGLAKSVAAGAAAKLGPKAVAALEKASALLETETGELTAATLGFVGDLVKGGKIGDLPSLDQLLSLDFNRHYQEFQTQFSFLEQNIMNSFSNLSQEINANAADCDDDECEDDECEGDDCEPDECEGDDCEPEDECEGDDCDPNDPKDNKDPKDGDGNDDLLPPPYPFPKPSRVCFDPSGYIYEAVPSNRVEGATAVVYYKDNVLDEEGNITGESDVMWDAENYDQVNPQITGSDGKYQWDVPQGWWQVRVQKEGWQNNNSDWLPVPPPQLDVNIPLVRNKRPEVKSAHAYEDAVTVKFDSYMLPDSLTAKHITVTENGNAVEGTITLTDEEAAPDGVTYASQLRFVPTKAFTANEVTLYVSGQVVNYAGIEMDEPFEAVLPVEKEVKGLAADKKVKVEYQSTGVIRVKGTPAAAAAGKTVTVKCMSGIITSVAQTSVVLDANGEAEVTVQGDLLGTDYVTFTLEDPELTASTTVKVVTEIKLMVEAPEASVATETEVEKGTEVTLTCSTEGAAIYYTLDGSSPLDSDTRILYDAPIVINTETTITAVTIVEGKGVSEVKIWHYTVIDDTGLTELSGTDMQVTPARVRDSFVVTGVEGVFSLRVYSMSGKLLLTLEQVRSGQRVDASALPAGIHLVVANTPAASFTQRIIKY